MDDALNSGFHAGGKKAYLDNLLLQQFNALRKLKRDGKLTPAEKLKAKRQIVIMYKALRRNADELLF